MTPHQEAKMAMAQAGANKAPRVTPADIEANIVSEWYFTALDGATADGVHAMANGDEGGSVPESLGLLTFCVLVLRNGFTATGESACASPENFNAEIGRRIARENSVSKVWPLMGYELRTKLANAPKPNAVDPLCVFRYCPNDDDCKARGRCVNRS